MFIVNRITYFAVVVYYYYYFSCLCELRGFQSLCYFLNLTKKNWIFLILHHIAISLKFYSIIILNLVTWRKKRKRRKQNNKSQSTNIYLYSLYYFYFFLLLCYVFKIFLLILWWNKKKSLFKDILYQRVNTTKK